MLRHVAAISMSISPVPQRACKTISRRRCDLLEALVQVLPDAAIAHSRLWHFSAKRLV
jgi:hypothetical protein